MENFGFKYEIGQELQLKVQVSLTKALNQLDVNKSKVLGGVEPHRLMVIERVLQQCPGGIQRHYRCRIHTVPDGGGLRHNVSLNRDVWEFNEIEVEPVA